MAERRRTIYLSALPKSWNTLSCKELEAVNKLMQERQRMSLSGDTDAADRHFKLQCFLLMLNLRITKRVVETESGELVFLLRKRGLSSLLGSIPMRAWQINQWIDSELSFLDEPYGRTRSPYTVVSLYGKKFKAPSSLLTDVTYQQYTGAQNLLTGYWDTLKLIEQLVSNRATSKAVAIQTKRLEEYQCRFLSALFTPSSIEEESVKSGSRVVSKRRVWVYDQRQIDENAWLFRRASHRMFPVMLQFFQSVQVHFSRIYPDLFTPGKKSSGSDMLKMEVETINAVMKYQGFKDYAEVYESESVRILGVLNTMSKDAKAMDEMNRKMKTKG